MLKNNGKINIPVIFLEYNFYLLKNKMNISKRALYSVNNSSDNPLPCKRGRALKVLGELQNNSTVRLVKGSQEGWKQINTILWPQGERFSLLFHGNQIIWY